MSFQSMRAEIKGCVPKIPYRYCPTLVNRAWRKVRESNLWSFLLFEGQWISPGIIKAGTAAVTQGSQSVVMDATASAAINAIGLSPFSTIIQRQFRVAAGGIYNIFAWDGINTLTLDRMYGEASATGTSYSIYQVYYAAPMKDFLSWVSVRDMRNFIELFTNKTRAQIDSTDPQRTWYYFPTDVVYYQQDQNPSSTTYLFPMFELWGTPQFTLNWQLYGIRRGTDLVNATDTLPAAIGEDCVLSLARAYAYEWAEANKGSNPRNVGPDFRFLMGVALKEHDVLLKNYRKQDRETCNNWFHIRRLGLYPKVFAYYSTISGTAFPGTAIGG